ncbi:CBS-domain-containing protein [Laetiporus sulphureus 93-53]|uniref:CBS-domain-containing protein n=1 Tax=Laetiporus sulphureus 93-53 TaxID=1314785 RepID=A0A165EF07_9APHY|nr:CBS-domain-containing protein [Laetiporus sulphureus 93-53]KZT06912.1 CBS-domain-containing protein [Laetiporus sulphureus 93-53]
MNSTLSNNSPRVRRKTSTKRPRAPSHLPPFSEASHNSALGAIRTYLRDCNSYDTFPVSFRLIVLDSKLEVRKALQCVVSAPLWNSEKSCFAGMFTVSDIIHLIQYYYNVVSSYEKAAQDVETFRLESLRDIEKELGVATPPMLREHPASSLYDAAKLLIQTHARRVPLLDNDTETDHEVIVSVLTQYRLLKFISINCPKEIQQLHLPLRRLNIGTYVHDSTLPADEVSEGYNRFHPIATATMSTTVFDVVHMFSQRGISAVPIVDEEGIVVNLYETVDVITLVRLGVYQSLDLTIAEALNQRSPDFPGVVICTASDSLGTLLQLIKKRRVHRLVVVEGEKGRLLGIITLSDVLRYIIGEPTIGEAIECRSDSRNEKRDSLDSDKATISEVDKRNPADGQKPSSCGEETPTSAVKEDATRVEGEQPSAPAEEAAQIIVEDEKRPSAAEEKPSDAAEGEQASAP